MAKKKKSAMKSPPFMAVFTDEDLAGLALLHVQRMTQERDRVLDAYKSGDPVKKFEAFRQTTFDGFWEEFMERREELVKEAARQIAEVAKRNTEKEGDS